MLFVMPACAGAGTAAGATQSPPACMTCVGGANGLLGHDDGGGMAARQRQQDQPFEPKLHCVMGQQGQPRSSSQQAAVSGRGR